jgi:hypothetical protein
MNFTQKLEDITNNLIQMPFKDVIDFAKHLDKNVEQAKQELLEEKKRIDVSLNRLQSSYYKFTELFNHPSSKPVKKEEVTCITKNIGGSNIKFPCIKKIQETKNYAGIPCCFKEIPGWFFINFPTLNQILPVKSSFNLFANSQNICSKINFNLFKDVSLEDLDTDFAIIPFTAETWSKFEEIPLAKWDIYLQQLNLDYYSIKRLPLYETTGLAEISKTISPEQMGIQWSFFVQTYFLLYIFKQVAPKENFSY